MLYLLIYVQGNTIIITNLKKYSLKLTFCRLIQLILFVNRKAAETRAGEDEEEEVETSREFVRWIARDHSRPCVGLQQSPFFTDILLSVGDWNFHIWKVCVLSL
jgi:hypothetical protein